MWPSTHSTLLVSIYPGVETRNSQAIQTLNDPSRLVRVYAEVRTYYLREDLESVRNGTK